MSVETRRYEVSARIVRGAFADLREPILPLLPDGTTAAPNPDPKDRDAKTVLVEVTGEAEAHKAMLVAGAVEVLGEVT